MRFPAKKTARKSQAKAPKAKQTAFKCPNCPAVIGSSGDLNRHIKTHDPTQTRHHCPHVGCPYRTVQKTNLTTHLRAKQAALQHQTAKSALLPMIPMLAQSFCALSLLPLDINMVAISNLYIYARTGRLTIRSQSTRTTTLISSLYINVRRLCLLI
ncbi:hypothetical protein BT96DRAFT_923370 [Gymnopus androsaceus JB14]|uniref:C2H2-type domain-containing protein n=1 Tax=Gymnopus androsaceus JB14 TaxID=1447944 RepID=A0A6A4H9F9_9AGAR|nr:hypothetical protein BT96DRAFT_923370 [Gymnopus androsaceus JB14]